MVGVGWPARAESLQVACAYERRGERLVRWEEETHLEGRPLPDTVTGRDWPVDQTDPRQGPALGQPVVVESIAGPGSERVRPGDTVVVALWTQTRDCEWIRPETALRPGSRYYLELRLRAVGAWRGRATFDQTPLDLWPHREESGAWVPYDAYRDWVRTLPTEAEWERDCRVAVQRVDSWLALRPELSRYPPLNNQFMLKDACETVLERKAVALEQPASVLRPGSEQITPGLRRWIDREGCMEGGRSDGARIRVAAGRFGDAPAPQWAVICQRRNGWVLAVVVGGPVPGTIELLRLPGTADGWRLSVAPREYLDWMSSFEHGWGESGAGDPRHGIVLLRERFVSKEESPDERPPVLAFYESGEGDWEQVAIRCCRWPQR